MDTKTNCQKNMMLTFLLLFFAGSLISGCKLFTGPAFDSKYNYNSIAGSHEDAIKIELDKDYSSELKNNSGTWFYIDPMEQLLGINAFFPNNSIYDFEMYIYDETLELMHWVDFYRWRSYSDDHYGYLSVDTKIYFQLIKEQSENKKQEYNLKFHIALEELEYNIPVLKEFHIPEENHTFTFSIEPDSNSPYYYIKLDDGKTDSSLTADASLYVQNIDYFNKQFNYDYADATGDDENDFDEQLFKATVNRYFIKNTDEVSAVREAVLNVSNNNNDDEINEDSYTIRLSSLKWGDATQISNDSPFSITEKNIVRTYYFENPYSYKKSFSINVKHSVDEDNLPEGIGIVGTTGDSYVSLISDEKVMIIITTTAEEGYSLPSEFDEPFYFDITEKPD